MSPSRTPPSLRPRRLLHLTALISLLLLPSTLSTSLPASLPAPPRSHIRQPATVCKPRLFKALRPRLAYLVGCYCLSSPSSPTFDAQHVRFYSYRPISTSSDTDAHTSAFLRCYYTPRFQTRLSALCTPSSSRSAFLRASLSVLAHCVTIAPNVDDGATIAGQPVTYDKTQCRASYVVESAVSAIDNAVNCECAQTVRERFAYSLVTGSFGYVIRGAVGVGGNQRELDVVGTCMRAAMPALDRVCGRQGRHFSMLVAHWFETCCKRARAGLRPSERKFECKRIVPDDVSMFFP